MHVLVIQTAFIGDAILASAVLEALNDHSEVKSVSLMLRKGNESLYKDHPYLKNLHVLDKSRPKFVQLGSMIKEVRSQNYDVVINLQRFAATGIITARSGAKVKIGFDKNPLSMFFTHSMAHNIGDGTHEVDRNLSLLEPLIGKVHARPRLYPSTDDLALAKRDETYLCMAPSSVWFTKQWPEEQWVELIKTIGDRHRILLLGSPADHELCQSIKLKSDRPEVENLCGKLNLLQSAALMRGAVMNIVNDSAPLHLASAMNAPVIAIYCSTVPAFGFGPLSDTAFIAEVSEVLDCRPCGLHGKKACPMGHFKCTRHNVQQIASLIP